MINTFWWKAKGIWDQQWWCKILDAPPFNRCDQIPSGKGGVVSIATDLYPQDFFEIQEMISKMPWVLLHLTSRESRNFPWKQLVHPRMKIWLQIPHADESVPDDVRMFGHMPHSGLVNGSPPAVEKTMGFLFAGQNTNEHRHRCVDELIKRGSGEGMILPTDGFSKGVSFGEYVQLMSAARIVPCPSGPVTASTFRVFEALECGALPIADRRCMRDTTGYNFWNRMLGYDPPFPTVADWSEVHPHLDRLQDINVWKQEITLASDWWIKYKEELKNNLVEDAAKLSM